MSKLGSVALSLFIALGVSSFAVRPANAQGAPVSQLIDIYWDLNTMCRGWSGDDPHTNEACAVREKVHRLLIQLGYCVDHQSGRWAKCRR